MISTPATVADENGAASGRVTLARQGEEPGAFLKEKAMRYGSVCSGIEAATAAWHPLGWEPAFFSEIEPFPRAVLAHHYPQVPLHGDFTTIGADQYGAIDLLVGGTPCQSFSIAGLRGGLDDDRGNLALEFLRLAQRKRPKWLVWENVPGVLSSNGGRDFGAILGGMVECGYGFAYRVLDAQFFGVPQRRRRVFVVGCLGDWRSAAAVLFERHSLQGHSAPRRQKGQAVAGAIARCSFSGGAGGRPEGAAGNHFVSWPAEVAPTLNAAFGTKLGLENQHIGGGLDCLSIAQCLTTGTGQRYDAEAATAVRRLTPVECERLQGFPDNFTRIPWRGKPAEQCPDSPRYKALGNSMAVPVMAWIGQRIQQVGAIRANPELADQIAKDAA